MYPESKQNPVGSLLAGHWFSKIYGALQDSSWSKRKIARFVADFNIPMHEFEPGPFANFNAFFIRQFRPGVRNFVEGSSHLAAPAEARYFAYAQVDSQTQIPVKGSFLTPRAVLGEGIEAAVFDGGPCLLARLCPVDYHRFHFPDDGKISTDWRISGPLHSVNPRALSSRPDIFASNERHVTMLDTAHFGRLAYVEVGAICVGKIVQTYSGSEFKRGEEKGCFLFGGSTVIIFGEPGAWVPDDDLLQNTAHGREVLVRLGESVAHV